MPYLQDWNLPQSVRENLDEEGQTVFRRAHNLALKEYGNEVSANRAAWQAVQEAGYYGRKPY